jgi:hypothetical protein
MLRAARVPVAFPIIPAKVEHVTCSICGRPAELREGFARPMHFSGPRSCK